MKKFFSTKTALMLAFCFSVFAMKAQDQRDATRENFSKALAKAMASQPVRDFLKSQFMLKQTGDYEVLYESIKNQRINGALTFAQTLQQQGSGLASDFFSSKICQEDPTLTIIMPEFENLSPEAWNTGSFVPKVAVQPVSYIEGTTLKLYNSTGTESAISTTVDPTELIVGSKSSETVVAVNPSTLRTLKGMDASARIASGELTLLFTGECWAYYLAIKSDGSDPVETRGSERGNCTQPCDRDCETTKDEITKMRFQSKDAWRRANEFLEGSLEGEIYITFVHGGLQNLGVNTLKKGFDGKKNKWLNGDTPKWRDIYAEVIHWVLNSNGDVMVYDFWEVDNSDFDFSYKPKIKVTIEGVVIEKEGLEITVEQKDDFLGQSVVEYCDAAYTPGYEYSTGTVRFFVRQK